MLLELVVSSIMHRYFTVFYKWLYFLRQPTVTPSPKYIHFRTVHFIYSIPTICRELNFSAVTLDNASDDDLWKLWICVWRSWSWTVLWRPTRPFRTPKKDVLFIIGNWNAKVGSQETPGVTGKFGLGVGNEAGQKLIEFCQENALVIAYTLFQQHKRRLSTWTSPDGQHWNQIDYILCS